MFKSVAVLYCAVLLSGYDATLQFKHMKDSSVQNDCIENVNFICECWEKKTKERDISFQFEVHLNVVTIFTINV